MGRESEGEGKVLARVSFCSGILVVAVGMQSKADGSDGLLRPKEKKREGRQCKQTAAAADTIDSATTIDAEADHVFRRLFWFLPTSSSASPDVPRR